MPRPLTGSIFIVALGGSLLLSCIIISAGKFYWWDELFSYYLIEAPTLGAMFEAYNDKINNTPIEYFFIGWLWAQMFGPSELRSDGVTCISAAKLTAWRHRPAPSARHRPGNQPTCVGSRPQAHVERDNVLSRAESRPCLAMHRTGTFDPKATSLTPTTNDQCNGFLLSPAAKAHERFLNPAAKWLASRGAKENLVWLPGMASDTHFLFKFDFSRSNSF